MKYLLLIYIDENAPQPSAEEHAADMGRWRSYSEDLVAAGVMLAGDPLQSTQTATTVRIRNDETLTTDGPFAETKEVLGGYYLIDVPHLDDALKWAAACPGAVTGSIEVRPLADFPSA